MHSLETIKVMNQKAVKSGKGYTIEDFRRMTTEEREAFFNSPEVGEDESLPGGETLETNENLADSVRSEPVTLDGEWFDAMITLMQSNLECAMEYLSGLEYNIQGLRDRARGTE